MKNSRTLQKQIQRCLSGQGIILSLTLAQLAFANPSAMVQALLGVASTTMAPAVLINPPSGVYFSPYLNATISTASGATHFKSKVGLSGSINCADQTGYSSETAIADSTPNTLYTSQTPAGTANDGHAYELGIQFQTYYSGKIVGVRYYRPPGETGSHTGRLWDSTQTLLSSVAFTGESASGWQQATFATPVSIEPDQIYTASVNANGDYPYTSSGLINPIINGGIFSVVGLTNGAFNNTAGLFPSSSFSQTDYFRDVVFTRTSHIVDDVTSMGGNNLKLCVVVRNSSGTWQDFSVATQATWYQAIGLLGHTPTGLDDSNSAGSAEAFQYTAGNTGNANYLRVYVRSGSAATTLIAGIYSDNSDSPDTLLGTGSLASPTAGTWNSVTLGSSVSLVSGTKYWIAILGTGGAINFNSHSSYAPPGPACMSSSTSLSSLPGTWSSDSCSSDSPATMIAY